MIYPNDAITTTIEMLSGTNTYTFFSSSNNTILNFAYVKNAIDGSVDLKCGSNTVFKAITSSVKDINIPLMSFCNSSITIDKTATDRGFASIITVPYDIKTATSTGGTGTSTALDIGTINGFTYDGIVISTFIFLAFSILVLIYGIGNLKRKYYK